MTLNEYQSEIERFAVYPGAGVGNLAALSYTVLGLNGEAGEVAEKLKKAMRDDGGTITPERRKALGGELGDVLWYVARCAEELGVNLEDVASRNIEKLTSRQERGVLGGSGDER